ncbi:MAG: phosphoribosylanthranilate isomerase [Planctomycetota bacterium]
MTDASPNPFDRYIPDRTRVKICGVRDIETALVAAQAGADAIGFVFVDDSPRSITPDDAADIMYQLPPLLSTVSVTRDLDLEAFSMIEQRCPTTMSQLHGKENESLCEQCGPGVIKGFRFEPATIESQLMRWEKVDEVDAVLIDGSDGGDGTPFDWNALNDPARGFAKPIFLAGGLTPANVADAIRAVRPFAVDVSSGVEREPGVKDHDLIAEFCAAVREADASFLG